MLAQMDDLSTLAARVARLEAIEEIRSLKARYWHACDRKDVEAVRACFADGPIEIAYDGTGTHHHRDALYELFRTFSQHASIVELHHGGPPQITVVDHAEATGIWSLSYHLTDTRRGAVHLVGGYYEDGYRRLEDGWRIVRARFSVCSAVALRWKDGALTVSHLGSKLAGGPAPVRD
jgi:hypothetical protein